jgi:putative phosphoribosyl transferase
MGIRAVKMASPRARPLAPSGPPAFADRTEAGVLLGAAVRAAVDQAAAAKRGHAPPGRARVPAQSGRPRPAAGPAWARVPPLVLALPRGGVPVAAGVAQALGAALDVLMVRKIGHPAAPELGLGAIAEDGGGGALAPFFDEQMMSTAGVAREDLEDVVTRERAELARRVAVYRPRPPADEHPARRAGSGPDELAGRLAVIVDDGLATGVTARAALRAVRARGPARTMLAVPVAAPAAVDALKNETDEVVTLVTPRRFHSVGEWYGDFGQLTDADVLTLLAAIP